MNLKTMKRAFALVFFLLLPGNGISFLLPDATKVRLQSLASSTEEAAAFRETQWERFEAVVAGNWRGRWSVYNSDGILVREDEDAGADIILNGKSAEHSLYFDGSTKKIGQYGPGQLGRHVLAASGTVVGPAVIPNGVMSTELSLRHKSARFRATIQHAPAYAPPGNDDTEEEASSFALKVYRVTLAREILIDSDQNDQDLWFRVDPFAWRRTWEGTTYLATPKSGPVVLEASYESDDNHWHNVRSADADYTLAQGNILLQIPTIITPEQGLKPLRMAWMPEPGLLLRAEAMILALDLDDSDEADDSQIRFLPPRLLAFQVDSLSADLKDTPSPASSNDINNDDDAKSSNEAAN